MWCLWKAVQGKEMTSEQENNYRDLTNLQLYARLQLTNKEITDLFHCIDVLIERASIINKIIIGRDNPQHEMEDK